MVQPYGKLPAWYRCGARLGQARSGRLALPAPARQPTAGAMSMRRICTRSSPFQRSTASEPAACTGRPRLARERRAELLAGGAERDDIDGRAVAAAQAGAQVRLAGLLHIGELMAGEHQHRLRIAGAERPGARDRGDGFEIGGAGRQGAIDQQPIRSARRRDRGAQPVFQIGAKRTERIAPERHPGRHGMAAALEQQPLAHRLAHRAAEIDAGDRAARAGADAALPERDRERRPAEALLEPRRHQPDHARMPARRGGDHHGAALLQAERRHGLRLGLLQRRDLDHLALAVEPVELGGEPRRPRSDPPPATDRRRASARPMRPPALMRGPSRKPRCQGSGGPPSRATSMSAVSPILSRRRSASSPLATKARLRPLSGTTSATVPSATRSSKPEQIGLAGAAPPRSRGGAARGWSPPPP